MTDLGWLDAVGQAELVRQGEVTPIELVDAAIARIDKVNPVLNAVIHERFDRARAEALDPSLPDGPFRGVPMVVKDLVCGSAGEPMHEGMRILKEAGWTESTDQYLATKFRDAGLITVGRTNTPELGILPTTEPEAYGPTRNPWDTGRSTGGSSGGSAAAVASGMVAVGHANDGGGSIRIPASECGLVGLKPSRGRTSLGPQWGDFGSKLVCEHVVTRSVRDCAAILDSVSGPMPGDPFVAPTPRRPYAQEVGADPGRLRIGMLTDAPGGMATTHADCIAAVDDAGRLLESLGHHVERSAPAGLDAPDFVGNFLLQWGAGVERDLLYWGRQLGRALTADDVEVLTWALADLSRGASPGQLFDAQDGLQRASRTIAAWWADGWDVLVTPTIAEPPPVLGSFTSPADNPLAGIFRAAAAVPFTPIFNVTGQPGISLPLSWSAAGLPIGVQFVSAYGREDLLLSLAGQLERARPWADRRPPVSA